MAEQTPEPTIIPGDPSVRKIAWGAFIAIVVLALVMRSWTQSTVADLHALAQESPEEAFARISWLLKAGVAFVGILSGVAATYFIIEAKRALAATRFPPPGTRVLFDTKVLTGKTARRRAIFMIVLSGLLIAAAFFLQVGIWYFVELLRPPG